MDEKAIRKAALISLPRAILENFVPGPEPEKRLEWLRSKLHARMKTM
jgi:hypothetical protein